MSSFYDILKAAKVGGNLPSYYETLFARKLPCSKYAWQETTLTGIPPLPFLAKGTPLTAYSIIGNMVQTGTPTQDAPIVPEETGDRTANLFDAAIAQGSFTFTGATNESPTRIRSDFMSFLLDAGTYTITANGAESTLHTAYTDANTDTFDKDNSDLSAWHNLPYTFTLSDRRYVRFAFRNNDNSRIYPSDISRIMLNTGYTALPYAPYGYALPLTVGGTTQTVYLAEPLRKIGDYADTVASDGTVTRKIKKLVLDGTENWEERTSYAYCDRFVLQKTGFTVAGQSGYCSHFDVLSVLGNSYPVMIYNDGSQIVVNYSEKGTATRAQFKQWLATQYANGTPVCVWYILTTPTTDSATCPTITPASGSNTLSVGTTLAPSSVSITGMIKEV